MRVSLGRGYRGIGGRPQTCTPHYFRIVWRTSCAALTNHEPVPLAELRADPKTNSVRALARQEWVRMASRWGDQRQEWSVPVMVLRPCQIPMIPTGEYIAYIILTVRTLRSLCVNATVI